MKSFAPIRAASSRESDAEASQPRPYFCSKVLRVLVHPNDRTKYGTADARAAYPAPTHSLSACVHRQRKKQRLC